MSKDDIEKTPAKDINIKLSTAWRAMPDDQKQKYNDMAKEDRARYDIERK